MTPNLIIDKVRELEYGGSPRWRAWREARKEFGYRKTYAAYLKSDEWRAFRDKYLKAHPICECCGEADASEVHHLSYQYLFFENMDMMQATCRPCHQVMTGIDNWESRERSKAKGRSGE